MPSTTEDDTETDHSKDNAPPTESTALLRPTPTASINDEPVPAKDPDAPLPMGQILCLCYARLYEPIAFFGIFPFINVQLTSLPLQDPPIPVTSVGFYSGLIESLFSATQMAFMLFWGRAADNPRIGRKPVLVVSLIGASISMAAFGFSQSIWQMIFWRCCAGMFGGTIVTIRTMISENSTPKTQARAFSFFAFSSNLGLFLGPLVGGSLADPVKQYPAIFHNNAFFTKYPYSLSTMVAGVIGLSATLVCALFVKETLQTTKDGRLLHRVPTKDRLSTWQLLRSPGVPTVLYLYGHVMVLAFTFTAVAPVFYFEPVSKSGLGFSPLNISVVLACAGIVQSLWILFAFPPLQERFSTGFVLRTCAIAYPFFFLMYPLLNVSLKLNLKGLFWAIFVPLNILGPGVSMSFTAIQLSLNDVNPHPSTLGSLNALALTLSSALRSVSPAAITSIYAIGIERWILNGYLAWVVMVILAAGYTVAIRRLPPQAEGKVRKGQEDAERA